MRCLVACGGHVTSRSSPTARLPNSTSAPTSRTASSPRHRLQRSFNITIWNKVKLRFKQVHTTSHNARELGHDFAKFYFSVVADGRHLQKYGP